MRFLARPPSPALAPYVARLWYHEGPSGLGDDRVLPSGQVQLIVDLAEAGGAGGGTIVAGPKTRPVWVSAAAMARVAGVLFRPAGITAFVEEPCAELVNADVGLGDLWGRPGREARSRLMDAPHPRAVLDGLEALLFQQHLGLQGPDPRVVGALAGLRAGASVAGTADRLGLSRPRLARLFERTLGLKPKTVAGLIRFQTTVRALAAGRTDLAQLALDAGYFDQAHMTRSFRRFAGFTPTQYRCRTDMPNHVRVVASDGSFVQEGRDGHLQ